MFRITHNKMTGNLITHTVKTLYLLNLTKSKPKKKKTAFCFLLIFRTVDFVEQNLTLFRQKYLTQI